MDIVNALLTGGWLLRIQPWGKAGQGQTLGVDVDWHL
jgi:hypothetical protein